MTTIVGVHGIGQQNKGPQSIENEWLPALRDGVLLAGKDPANVKLRCAFYGKTFRGPGRFRGANAGPEEDEEIEFEGELLKLLWLHAAQAEPGRVQHPETKTRAGTPSFVQAALRALSRSRFFVRITEPALLGDLRQVKAYLFDSDVRERAQNAIDSVMTEEASVIVAHSLGSVVAYESLIRFSTNVRWQNVHTFLTLGSPLGIRNLIFDRLKPAPIDGLGHWPRLLSRWVNISDDGDIVALEKRLKPLFQGEVVDIRVNNGATAHDVGPYLTAKETGQSIPYA